MIPYNKHKISKILYKYIGREAATLLSIGFWARNHYSLEHIDVVVGRDRYGVPRSSSPITIKHGPTTILREDWSGK